MPTSPARPPSGTTGPLAGGGNASAPPALARDGAAMVPSSAATASTPARTPAPILLARPGPPPPPGPRPSPPLATPRGRRAGPHARGRCRRGPAGAGNEATPRGGTPRGPLDRTLGADGGASPAGGPPPPSCRTARTTPAARPSSDPRSAHGP